MSEESREMAYRNAAMRVLDKNTYLRNVPYSDPTTDLDSYASALADYRGEFTWSATFDPTFIAELMYRGFLPMSTDQGGIAYLLPKLHVRRCVMRFKDLHVSKQVRKRAKHFRLTVDRRMDQVVAGINGQHNDDSWFYPELVEAFKEIQQHGGKGGLVRVHSIELWQRVITEEDEETQQQQQQQQQHDSDKGGASSYDNANHTETATADLESSQSNKNNKNKNKNKNSRETISGSTEGTASAAATAGGLGSGVGLPTKRVDVEGGKKLRGSDTKRSKAEAAEAQVGDEVDMISKNMTVTSAESSRHVLDMQMEMDGELWELVAGEVGYACGASFTSLSGYSSVNHSGSVQCVALALFLKQAGFTMWDLGMGMEYKEKMGALNLPRAEFISMLTDARDRMDCPLIVPKYVEAGVLVKQHFDRLRSA